MKMKSVCRRGLSILLTLCMVLALLPTITPHAQAAGIVTRTTSLDLSVNNNITYHNSSGGTGSANPYTQNILDTAEGWAWYHTAADGYTAKTLVLDGLDLETSAMRGIYLPLNSTIVLAPESSNRVAVVNSAGGTLGYGVSLNRGFMADPGNLTVKGSGVLSVTVDADVAKAIDVSSGQFNLESGTVYAKVDGSVNDLTLFADPLGPNIVAYQKSTGGDYTLATTWLQQYLTFYYNDGANRATDIKMVNGTLPSESATVSNQTVSGKVGAPLSGTNAAAITLTGLTFEDLAVEDDVSGWFSGLPDGLSASVSALTETTATLVFSGTPEAASSAVMSITIPGDCLSIEDDVVVAANSSARFEIVQLVARTTALDFYNNGTITYQTSSGETGNANPTTQNITNTAEGWAWYHTPADGYSANTLVLDGINLVTGSDVAIQMAYNSTVMLTNGSSNTVTTTYNSQTGTSYNHCIGIWGIGQLTVKGGGMLTATSGNTNSNYSVGLMVQSDLTIQGSTILARAGLGAQSSAGLHTGGTLSIENATVTATGADNISYSYGVYAGNSIVISESAVTATGGNAYSASFGMFAGTGNIAFSGGTTHAKGRTFAVRAASNIVGDFMTAHQKDSSLTSNTDADYTLKATTVSNGSLCYYVYGNSAAATDLRIAPAPLGFPGSGTEEDPYQISTAAQLKEMSNRVNNQNDLFGDKHYELTADIVLNEDLVNEPEQWNPIGGEQPFTGVFDGNSHTIRGLYINSNRDYVGLFGFIEEASVRNVGLVGGQIASDSAYCFVGGLVGFAILGTVEDCYNTGSVSGTISGGIVGLNAGGHIQDSYNTGAIAASGDGCASGGIAGETQNADFTIVNCYNTGSVSASVWEEDDEGYVGGITGVNDKSSIKNCYSTGALLGDTVYGADIYVGGIAGSSTLDEDSTIENAYWLETSAVVGVTDDEQDGCISKTLAEMKAAAFVDTLNTNAQALEDTYETLSPWRTAASGENDGYPVLGASFTLTISGGGTGATASGNYAAGTAVPISAGTRDGYTFNGWTTENGGSFASAAAANTTFTMPGANVTITAGWRVNSGSSGGNGGSDATQVIVNGQTVSAGTSRTATDADGSQVTTVTIDSGKLQTILAAQTAGATVTIPFTNNADRAVGTLTGQMVKRMEDKEAVLVVRTPDSSYTLPASQINIDAVSKQLGANVELTDITVSVSVSAPSNEMSQIVENAEKEGAFTLVAPAVNFTIACTYGGKTIPVGIFNSYVERTIAIPQGVDPSKITTGVVVEPDGTVHHVPTRVTVINGKYYAVINSLTNSTYSVIWNPIAFSDVTNHWAKNSINNMGSRMVVTGIGNNTYEPNRNMTRAEFATIMVRALGLEPGTNASSFSDVSASDWYSGYIDTAASYGIIKGYLGGTFGPNDTITREQAMTMVARAMKVTGLNAGLTNGESNQLIGAYTDAAAVSAYARDSIAACLKTGVVSGTGNQALAPKSYVTRAEVAVMAERLLQKSELI